MRISVPIALLTSLFTLSLLTASITLPATGAEPIRVLLGDPSLTAGIPGEGPLKLAEIEKWLADEENHAPLEVKLPKGISGAAANIYIPADNPLTKAKVELGRQLYFDRRLSSDNTISCADCHHPDEGYARNTQFGVGVEGQTGNRNSPVSYNRILTKAQFWDGRAESLEAQAIGPIANPIEMGNTHEVAVKDLRAIPGYVMQFKSIFGDEPLTIEMVGKAIAAFERTLVTGPSAYDYYEPLRNFERAFADDLEDLDALKEDDEDLYDQYMAIKKLSDSKPMSESARRGRTLFFDTKKTNCTACHAGANFADEKYHNLGVGMDVQKPDLGRYEVTKKDEDRGAFKTPTLRNVALSPPYMHDGSQKTLLEVVEWYAKGGHPNEHLSKDIRKLDLTPQDKADLVQFMEALNGDFPKVETSRLPADA